MRYATAKWQYLECAVITRAGQGEDRPVVSKGFSNLADWERFLFRSAL